MVSGPGRNEPCHCGSGKKYKQCHLAKDEDVARAARAEAAAVALALPPAESADADVKTAKATPPRTHQPWKKSSATNTHGFQRMSTPRKVGGGG